MKIEFLSKQRANSLQESISFLSSYKGPEEGVQHQIGSSNKIEDRDEKFSELLEELGKINKRREEIINLFK
jgi:hypothetical protein